MVTYLLFVAGFIFLLKGADVLVDGASSVAKRFNVSDLVIGLTVVAFGTSLPELFVNVYAGLQGDTEIAIGNVLGSNIANILLILGVASLIHPLSVQRPTVWKEIPFSLLAALLLAVMANDRLLEHKDFSEMSRIDGIVLFAFFIIFMYYIFEISRKSKPKEESEIEEQGLIKSFAFIVLGLFGLVFGGKWIVDGAVKIAHQFHVSEALIGLSVVAIGTSLPELATSAVAAYRKKTDIAIGNVVGSNIFNIFFVLGISASINPLPFNAESNTDIAMTIFASLLLFAFVFVGRKHLIERWQGILFLLIYAGYMAFLFYRG